MLIKPNQGYRSYATPVTVRQAPACARRVVTEVEVERGNVLWVGMQGKKMERIGHLEHDRTEVRLRLAPPKMMPRRASVAGERESTWMANIMPHYDSAEGGRRRREREHMDG